VHENGEIENDNEEFLKIKNKFNELFKIYSK
jgi:hypothetical protein